MTEETFSRYDTADYLKSEQDIAAYLDAVMEEAGDDPAFVARALGTVARARSMAQLARATGMSREGLYKALSGEGNPSFATVMKVAHALGLRLRFQAEHAWMPSSSSRSGASPPGSIGSRP